MLHVVNGDATAARLAPAALPGEVLVWRDILVEGPADADLDIAALAARRAPWLERRFGIPADAYVAGGRAQQSGLARAAGHEEIVLWFEQDLFCVANLAHLAAWVERVRPSARPSLVFPSDPLGSSTPDTLATLFATRRPLAPDDVARAASWWRAFAAPVPRTPESCGRHGALAFLEDAWRLHLARFPSVRTGLGAVEAAALAALDDAPRAFDDVLRAAGADTRVRGHGISDVQLAACLRALTDGPAPLARIAHTGGPPTGAAPMSEHTFRAWELTATADGRAVREGRRDRLDAQPLDWWLGGVRLDGRRTRWRWDEQSGQLIEGSGQA